MKPPIRFSAVRGTRLAGERVLAEDHRQQAEARDRVRVLAQPAQQRVLDQLEHLGDHASRRTSPTRRTRPNARCGERRQVVEQVGQVLGLDRRPGVAEQRAELADQAGERARAACPASRRSPAACRAPASAPAAAPRRSGAGSRRGSRPSARSTGVAAQRVVVQDLLGQVPDRRDLAASASSGSATSATTARTISRTRSTIVADERARRREQRVDVARGRSRRCRRCRSRRDSSSQAASMSRVDAGERQVVFARGPSLMNVEDVVERRRSPASTGPTAAPNGPVGEQLSTSSLRLTATGSSVSGSVPAMCVSSV